MNFTVTRNSYYTIVSATFVLLIIDNMILGSAQIFPWVSQGDNLFAEHSMQNMSGIDIIF